MSASGCPWAIFFPATSPRGRRKAHFGNAIRASPSCSLIGSTIHYAMARHVLGAKNFPPSDEAIVDQFVDLALGGLEQRHPQARAAKGKQK